MGGQPPCRETPGQWPSVPWLLHSDGSILIWGLWPRHQSRPQAILLSFPHRGLPSWTFKPSEVEIISLHHEPRLGGSGDLRICTPVQDNLLPVSSLGTLHVRSCPTDTTGLFQFSPRLQTTLCEPSNSSSAQQGQKHACSVL